MTKKTIVLQMLALVVCWCVAEPATARIKLITLPVRERVEIQLDHTQATLVEEERIVPLVVQRTIEKNQLHRVAGNLYNIEVIVKYEVENFKDQAVTLDVTESLKAIRKEVYRDTGRDVEWELGDQTTFSGGPDETKSDSDRKTFHADLPARGADTKATKLVHKLHFIIKHEW